MSPMPVAPLVAAPTASRSQKTSQRQSLQPLMRRAASTVRWMAHLCSRGPTVATSIRPHHITDSTRVVVVVVGGGLTQRNVAPLLPRAAPRLAMSMCIPASKIPSISRRAAIGVSTAETKLYWFAGDTAPANMDTTNGTGTRFAASRRSRFLQASFATAPGFLPRHSFLLAAAFRLRSAACTCPHSSSDTGGTDVSCAGTAVTSGSTTGVSGGTGGSVAAAAAVAGTRDPRA